VLCEQCNYFLTYPMPVRKTIPEKDGVYFISFTCARWLPLFALTNSYNAVYKWLDILKKAGHYIIGYIIMPNHVHAIIAFYNTGKTINSIVGNGKRFMAYDLVTQLEKQQQNDVLKQLGTWVNNTQKLDNKQHEVFEPSFDWKECRTEKFIIQKLNYMHNNPCVAGLCLSPEEYEHSSARFYITGMQSVYAVTSFMELQDIDLTK
jgi:hypothetical protein